MNALRALNLAVLAWRRAESLNLPNVRVARTLVMQCHEAVLKIARGRAPLDWSLYPTARDFFLQWEAGDMTRVLALGRRW